MQNYAPIQIVGAIRRSANAPLDLHAWALRNIRNYQRRAKLLHIPEDEFLDFLVRRGVLGVPRVAKNVTRKHLASHGLSDVVVAEIFAFLPPSFPDVVRRCALRPLQGAAEAFVVQILEAAVRIGARCKRQGIWGSDVTAAMAIGGMDNKRSIDDDGGGGCPLCKRPPLVEMTPSFRAGLRALACTGGVKFAHRTAIDEAALLAARFCRQVLAVASGVDNGERRDEAILRIFTRRWSGVECNDDDDERRPLGDDEETDEDDESTSSGHVSIADLPDSDDDRSENDEDRIAEKRKRRRFFEWAAGTSDAPDEDEGCLDAGAIDAALTKMKIPIYWPPVDPMTDAPPLEFSLQMPAVIVAYCPLCASTTFTAIRRRSRTRRVEQPDLDAVDYYEVEVPSLDHDDDASSGSLISSTSSSDDSSDDMDTVPPGQPLTSSTSSSDSDSDDMDTVLRGEPKTVFDFFGNDWLENLSGHDVHALQEEVAFGLTNGLDEPVVTSSPDDVVNAVHCVAYDVGIVVVPGAEACVCLYATRCACELLHFAFEYASCHPGRRRPLAPRDACTAILRCLDDPDRCDFRRYFRLLGVRPPLAAMLNRVELACLNQLDSPPAFLDVLHRQALAIANIGVDVDASGFLQPNAIYEPAALTALAVMVDVIVASFLQRAALCSACLPSFVTAVLGDGWLPGGHVTREDAELARIVVTSTGHWSNYLFDDDDFRRVHLAASWRGISPTDQTSASP